MIKVLLNGYFGKMGQTIVRVASKDAEIVIAEGVDKFEEQKKISGDVVVFNNINNCSKSNVVIDFSHPSALGDVLNFCKKTNTPVVLATTGYSQQDLQTITEFSATVPIFFSSNMSVGIYALNKLINSVLPIVNGWDIEVLEKHHKAKKDSPSGTALSMLKEVEKFTKNYNVTSLRCGNVAGEHEIGFYGENEILTIKHEALSKEIFAVGALKAAKFMVNKPAKLYGMEDLFKN